MLTTYRGGNTSQTNLAHEGRLLEAILKAEVRCGVSRLRLATAGSRGIKRVFTRVVTRYGVPPARHDDLAARSSLYGSGGNAGDGSAAPGTKSPRWSAERRASLR